MTLYDIKFQKPEDLHLVSQKTKDKYNKYLQLFGILFGSAC